MLLTDSSSNNNFSEGVSAVFFEDRSSVIDYSNFKIDLNLERDKFNGIKRIGKGKLQYKKNGLNFYLNNKFFRFDFYRIVDVAEGENFLALFQKRSDSVKLFLMDDTNSIGSIENLYAEYTKNYN